MKSFTLVLGCLAAIVLGAHGRATVYGPEEKTFGFNEIADVTRDVVDFKKLVFNWRLAFERNGDFLGITVEALDDVSHLKADFSITLIQRSEEALVAQHFHEDFTSGEKKIGSTKYMAWEELVNTKRGIVVDDLVFVRVKMELVQYPNLSF